MTRIPLQDTQDLKAAVLFLGIVMAIGLVFWAVDKMWRK